MTTDFIESVQQELENDAFRPETQWWARLITYLAIAAGFVLAGGLCLVFQMIGFSGLVLPLLFWSGLIPLSIVAAVIEFRADR